MLTGSHKGYERDIQHLLGLVNQDWVADGPPSTGFQYILIFAVRLLYLWNNFVVDIGWMDIKD